MKRMCGVCRLGSLSLRSPLLQGVIAVLVAWAVLSGCSKGPAQDVPPGASKGPATTLPVKVAPVLQKTVPVQLKTFGTVEAYSTVQVRAQVNGELTGVLFEEGQEVKKGDVIFTLDSRPFETAIKQAEAALAKDTAMANNAKTEAARAQSLFKDGVYTQEQYDNAKANEEALAAAVRADAAAVENAKLLLGYCTIRSPMDGRAGSHLIERGNLVKANDIPAMVVINQIHPIYVSFSIPEQQLPLVRKYMAMGKIEVQAFIPGDEGEPARGVVTFVDNTIDPATGTIRLKGTFQNADGRLWPGQYVNVVVTLTNEPNALVIPVVAVQTGQAGQYVFVVKKDNTVESRPVTVGRALNEETVIEKGLKVGESVVTDGQFRLVPGARVEVQGGRAESEKRGG